MISGKEVHVSDINAEFHGIPTINLMENAGKHVADFVSKTIKPKSQNILVFCGLGNNGGDGLVAARYLSKKYNVTIFIVGKSNKIKTKISQNNYKKLKEIKIYDISSLKILDELLQKGDLIIDSMLGIGISGKLRAVSYTHLRAHET